MKLYWCPKTRSVRVLWMLEELGRPYERELVDIRDQDAERSAEFLETSPMGKVPALADGEARMAESAAICLYLADRYAPGALAPAADDPDRARFLYWIFYTPAVIEPAMTEKFAGLKPNRFTYGWGDWQTMLDTLERGLGDGPWILGDRFSAADVMVGSSAVFMRDFKVLPESAILDAYADRCLERAAYQRALDLDRG